MKIQASASIEVTLTEDHQKEVALKYLYGKLKWGPKYFIDNENVYNKVHYHTGFYEEPLIRPATDTDYALAQIIAELRIQK